MRLGFARVGCLKTTDLPLLNDSPGALSMSQWLCQVGYVEKMTDVLLLECALFFREKGQCLNTDALH